MDERFSETMLPPDEPAPKKKRRKPPRAGAPAPSDRSGCAAAVIGAVYLLGFILSWPCFGRHLEARHPSRTYGDLIGRVLGQTAMSLIWPMGWAIVGLEKAERTPLPE